MYKKGEPIIRKLKGAGTYSLSLKLYTNKDFHSLFFDIGWVMANSETAIINHRGLLTRKLCRTILTRTLGSVIMMTRKLGIGVLL